jgi:uncharacterized protein with ParB-like and HNH nuclease domain
MAQDENGNWEVVDGMQRLSTILDFIGVLKQENKDKRIMKDLINFLTVFFI